MIEPDGETQTSSDGGKAENDHGVRGEISPSDQSSNGLKLEALELDYSLILRAQRLTTGATVHRFSQALTIYICNVELWNRFVAQGRPASPGELQEKTALRTRALDLQVQLRQEVLKEELRSIATRNGRFS
jgi:hypothetical protein